MYLTKVGGKVSNALKPRPFRRPEGRRMTITVGFPCSDGVVLGADSQESLQGSNLKRSVPKLVIAPPLHHISAMPAPASDRRAIFTGAGHATLIDKLISEAWLEIAVAPPSVDDMAAEVERGIGKLYKEYRQMYHAAYMPTAELLYAIWCGNETKLFYANGPIVNSVGGPFGSAMVGYKATGTGSEITDYIARRAYNKNASVGQAAILAMYMLRQAVEHAEGCGGEIHIASLKNTGEVESLDTSLTLTATILDTLDENVGSLMLAAADASFKADMLDTLWGHIKSYVLVYREKQAELETAQRVNREHIRRIMKDIVKR